MVVLLSRHLLTTPLLFLPEVKKKADTNRKLIVANTCGYQTSDLTNTCSHKCALYVLVDDSANELQSIVRYLHKTRKLDVEPRPLINDPYFM